jgi:hypothetical protein
LSKEEAEKILKKAQASRALRDKDFAKYEKLTLELYQDTSLSSEELNSLAWNFFENVSNKASSGKGISLGTGICKERQKTSPIPIL